MGLGALPATWPREVGRAGLGASALGARVVWGKVAPGDEHAHAHQDRDGRVLARPSAPRRHLRSGSCRIDVGWPVVETLLCRFEGESAQ